MDYSGAIYHVINLGDLCEAIFLDHQDRELILKTLGGGVRQVRLAGVLIVF